MSERAAGPELADRIDPGFSEFGQRLAELLREIPAIDGAVITDDEGDAIDWARREHRIAELDVQLLGAQIGMTLARLDAGWTRLGLGAPRLTVWANDALLVARPILRNYLLALRVRPGTDYRRLGAAFERAADDVRALIG